MTDLEPEKEVRAWLSEIDSDLARLITQANLTAWDAATNDTPETRDASVAAEAALRKYLSSKERHSRIEAFLSSSELRDPALRRQLELLSIEHLPNQLPESTIDDLVQRSWEIQSEFYSYRARIGEREVTDNELISIMRNERDETRRLEAWHASKQIGPRISQRLIELVGRRNEAARSVGFRDYYAMRLQLQEIDEEGLFDIFAELRRRTDEPFRQAKEQLDERVADRYRIRPQDLRPWHYDDPFFQEPPLSDQLGIDKIFSGQDVVDIAVAFYDGVGLPVRDILERSDLEERERKDQHAFCVDIDREGDVRILCNVKDDERWMSTLLHELGHAVYDKFIPGSLPWLLREPAHIAVTEAVAMFMDRLTYNVDWLEAAVPGAVENRDALKLRATRALRFQMLLMARWTLVMTLFERALYENPTRGDLDSLWWDLVEEIQLVRRPEGRSAPDWATKIHFTAAPVYYHNYMLGELIASQLGAAFRREVMNGVDPGGYNSRSELGGFLRDRIFTHGARSHWQALLEQATGSRLSPDAFLAEFVASPGDD